MKDRIDRFPLSLPCERELPPILSFEELQAMDIQDPPLLIEGLLHQGCKMVLGSGSKSNKTWALLDLALSVASGAPWWGLKTTRANVAYLNFELPAWTLGQRLQSLRDARPELTAGDANLYIWNLRGFATDLSEIVSNLEDGLDSLDLGLIIFDPVYKLLGDRDENSNGHVAQLMNEFEHIAQRTGAAIVFAHHFSKGDPSIKDPIDRLCGAGAWARDPDTIAVLTPHEESDCYTVSSSVRCLPPHPDFVIEWQFPVMQRASDLDPATLRQRGARKKICTDRDFIALLSTTPTSRKNLLQTALDFGLSQRTFDRYLSRLSKLGLIGSSSGLYWKKD